MEGRYELGLESLVMVGWSSMRLVCKYRRLQKVSFSSNSCIIVQCCSFRVLTKSLLTLKIIVDSTININHYWFYNQYRVRSTIDCPLPKLNIIKESLNFSQLLSPDEGGNHFQKTSSLNVNCVEKFADNKKCSRSTRCELGAHAKFWNPTATPSGF